MSLHFERRRQTAGLFLGPLLFLVVLALPVDSLAGGAHRLAALLAWTIVFWVTEAIPLPATALLAAVLATLLQIAPAHVVFAPFANPVIFLFLGSFVIAEAMSRHGLDRRFALAILSLPWVGASPKRILTALAVSSTLGSMWISNTAMTAIMLPIVLGILRGMNPGEPADEPGHPEGARGPDAAALLLVAYGASIGGLGTPVGSPTNLVGLGMIQQLLEIRISFFQWMLLALPLVAAMILLVVLGLAARSHRAGGGPITGMQEFLSRERARLGPWSRGQKNSLAAFAVAVLLWILPGLAALLLPGESSLVAVLNASLPEAVAALVAALLLFLLPLDWSARRFTIEWRDAARIDWGTILLFGGGLSLGALMSSTGLAQALGQGLVQLTGASSLWGLTAVAILAGILVTEVVSNTATASMLLPVIIAVSQAAGVNPLPPALGATLACSYAFMLPIATPPNAIVYGTGRVPITTMIAAGAYANLCGAVTLWVGLRLLCPWLGLA